MTWDTGAALRSLWNDRLVVTTYEKAVDPTDNATVLIATTWDESIPCRISFSSSPNSEQSNASTTETAQRVKLFLSKDHTIPPGSKLTVSRQGLVYGDFALSGLPAVYSYHQEITLTAYKGRA